MYLEEGRRLPRRHAPLRNLNILKHGMPVEELNKLIIGLFMLDNVEMYGVV